MSVNGYKGEGSKINKTATGAVSAGDLVQFTDIVGVALIDGVSGDVIPCAINGEFEVVKTAAADSGFTQGDSVYVTSSGVVNNTSSGDKFVGFASAAAATGALAVDVIIAQ